VAPPTLHVLTGCTAAGKTESALRWAEATGGEIISCDSLLFYRGMDVGTAKPTAAERARAPHHLIDIMPVAEGMDITRYVSLARAAAAEIHGRGRPVLVVGGSGFYLKAFFAAVADDVAVPPAVRAEVAARLAAGGLPGLQRELARLNPGGVGALDLANPRRVARALERSLATGRPYLELAAEFARRPSPFADWRVRLAEIARPPEELDRRIQERAERMLADGLVEEVRGLLGAGLRENPSAAKAIGYREVIACLEGALAPGALAPTIAGHTRALVKKQRTWFRTQLPAHPVWLGGELRSPAELFPAEAAPAG
jgi:tRNA dimethylallyltransferase